MIDAAALTAEWFRQRVPGKPVPDPNLAEKSVRALMLLEGLVLHRLDFVFKGGTALMLHLGSGKRFSIDIDIIMESHLDAIELIFDKVAASRGFTRWERQNRKSESLLIKSHFKFFYLPLHRSDVREEYILLDIVYESPMYCRIGSLPITSPFAQQLGQPLVVPVPGLEDLLGDKLTAFAPNTVGIPYHRNSAGMGMEIIKQLYDIGSIFNFVLDLKVVREVFFRLTNHAIGQRQVIGKSVHDVIEDIFQTALCIASRGKLGRGDNHELHSGIRRIKQYIFSEPYPIEKVVVHASIAAYLSVLLKMEIDMVDRYQGPVQLRDLLCKNPDWGWINKLKRSNPEAFFYLYQVQLLRIGGSAKDF